MQKYNRISSLTLFLVISHPTTMNHIPNLKYKTTLCLNWAQEIYCDKEDGCYFAHGQEELRTLEQNRIAIAQRNKAALQYRPIENYKTIFCKFYGKGECKLGQACTYAHQRRQKKAKQSNPITSEQQNPYALQAYYSQYNSWMGYTPYYLPAQPYQYSNNAEYEGTENMKMSTETASEENSSSPSLLQKDAKSIQSVGKYGLTISQEIQEPYSLELNSIS